MRAHLSAIALAAVLLAGCATSGELALTEEEEALAAELQARSIVPATADERAAIANQDLLTQAAFWAEAYELNPGDREAALQLSIVLRKLNGAPRAAESPARLWRFIPMTRNSRPPTAWRWWPAAAGRAAVEPLSRSADHPSGRLAPA
jgi:hypothetical protein